MITVPVMMAGKRHTMLSKNGIGRVTFQPGSALVGGMLSRLARITVVSRFSKPHLNIMESHNEVKTTPAGATTSGQGQARRRNAQQKGLQTPTQTPESASMIFPLIELGVLVVLGIILLYCLVEITTR